MNYEVNNRLTIGASVGYRAEIAWRDTDPRIHTIVSALDVKAGASLKCFGNRLLGVSAVVSNYSQNCDLDFYNPLNDINTLPLTGLGSYNNRFAGNTNKNSGHSGWGIEGGAQWLSCDKTGLQAALSGGTMRVSQLLRNFNNLTYAYADTRKASGKVGYGFCFEPRIKAFPVLMVDWSMRRGTENLFGTAAGASYDRIGSYSPYERRCANARLEVPVEINIGQGYLTAEPAVGYSDWHEKLATMQRSIDVSKIHWGLSVHYTLRSADRWLFAADARCELCSALTSKLCMPGYDATDPLQLSVAETSDRLADSSLFAGAGVSASRLFGSVLAGISVRYSHTDYKSLVSRNCIYTTIEIKF